MYAHVNEHRLLCASPPKIDLGAALRAREISALRASSIAERRHARISNLYLWAFACDTTKKTKTRALPMNFISASFVGYCFGTRVRLSQHLLAQGHAAVRERRTNTARTSQSTVSVRQPGHPVRADKSAVAPDVLRIPDRPPAGPSGVWKCPMPPCWETQRRVGRRSDDRVRPADRE